MSFDRDIRQRDDDQRKMGCMSFSFLMHIALLAAVFIIPHTPLAQMQEGTKALETTYVDLTAVPNGESEESIAQMPAFDSRPMVAKQEEIPAVEEVAPIVVQTPKAKKVVAKKTTKAKVAKRPARVPKPVVQKEESKVEAPEVREVVDQENVDAEAVPVAQVEPDATTETADESELDKELDNALASASEKTANANTAQEKTEKAPAPSAAQERSAVASRAADASAPANKGLSSGIRDASELAERPGNRPPEYPVRDRLVGNQGTVVFVARVNPDGSVRDVMIEQGAKSKTLDIAAFEAMKKWRFMPGQDGLVRKAFTFNLQGTAAELPARLRRVQQ